MLHKHTAAVADVYSLFMYIEWNTLHNKHTISWVQPRFIFTILLICSHASVQDVPQDKRDETKALFILKRLHLRQRLFDIYCHLNVLREIPGCRPCVQAGSAARGRPEVVSSPWYSPSSLFPLSLSFWSLIGWFCSDLPGQECTHLLMYFYVQAIWQWRVPSFCSINISFPIWMQIRDVTPGIQMGCLSHEK